jgi:regulatory protein
MEEKKIILDYKSALIKAQKHCAYQERSQQEIRNKLYEWGLHYNEVEEAISELISNDYINEERFAIQLAGGKFRIKHWGKLKITQALKLHKITPYCIKKALQQIPDEDYERSLRQIIEKKNKMIKGKLTPLKARKIVQFAQSKGYESELIWKLIKTEHPII